VKELGVVKNMFKQSTKSEKK